MKAIELFETFNKMEIVRFQKYLISPFFNENADSIALFSSFLHFLDKDGEPEKEKVWKKAFKNRKYNDLEFRQKTSVLVKLAEKFLLHQKLEQEGINTNFDLAKLLLDRKLPKHFQLYKRKIIEWKKKNEGADTIKKELQFQELELSFLSLEKNRLGKNNFNEIHESIDQKYILEKLKYVCESINYMQVRNVEINLGIGDVLMESLPHSGYLKTPVINIYYNIYLLLMDLQNVEKFQGVKSLIKKYYSYFNFEEVYYLYTYLQNVSIRQINSGNNEYLSRLVNVYMDMMEIGVLKEIKSFTPWMYKNIITAGLLSKNFDWVKLFLEEYKNYLTEKEKENAYSYNLANFFFYKKEYDSTIEILNQIQFSDVAYELDGRLLLMRAYYETNEHDALESLLSSFRLYLMRNKLITPKMKKQYQNLIRFTNKLLKILPHENEKLSTLKKAVEEQEDIVNKSWLLSKIRDVH